MKFKELTEQDKNSLFEMSLEDSATFFSVNIRTISKWKEKLKNNKKENKFDVVSDDKKKLHRLEEENKLLKKSLSEAKKHVHESDEIKELIYSLNDVEYTQKEIPEWVNKQTKSKLVPVLCIADVHLGEVVNPEDVNFVNEFNTEIAIKRINQCVDDFIDIYKNKFNNYSYDGIVVNILGDIITGELHDLAETNDKTSIDQIITAVDLLETQIRKLQKQFNKVLVNLVSGNHGRQQPLKYTKNSNRYHNSLEKIVYTFVERNISDLDGVVFNTSPEDVLRVSINGHRFQIEHGDKIKTTGTAIAGPSTSFARAYLKKSKVGVSTNAPFQTLMIGHFHNHYYAGSVMVCNSVKGYDSYCASLGIDFSLPGCTSFAVNSHGQIIFLTDIQIRTIKTQKPTKSIELF